MTFCSPGRVESIDGLSLFMNGNAYWLPSSPHTHTHTHSRQLSTLQNDEIEFMPFVNIFIDVFVFHILNFFFVSLLLFGIGNRIKEDSLQIWRKNSWCTHNMLKMTKEKHTEPSTKVFGSLRSNYSKKSYSTPSSFFFSLVHERVHVCVNIWFSTRLRALTWLAFPSVA